MIGMAEFRRWSVCWFVSTSAVFLAPNFFTYAVILVGVFLVARRHGVNPLGLYIILIFTAPCLGVGVGIPGIFNRVLDLNVPRLLSMVILAPMAVSLLRKPENRKLTPTDLPLALLVGLMSLLALRHADLASILRSVPGYYLDIALPYFVFSRQLRSAQDVNHVLLAFVVAIMPLAIIGAFEFLKSWRVYNPAMAQWGLHLFTPYLFRDGMLRAATTAIEPIAFGVTCMCGAASLATIRHAGIPVLWRWVAFSILFAGLMASISRGPWLGFALFGAILFFANVRTSIKIASWMFVPALIVGSSMFSKLERFVDLLPFVGHADPGSETYRSELFKNAIIVIDRYPIFGSISFLSEPEMLQMVQGQGIIDVVNSYLQLTLEFGVIGLLLFVSFFSILCIRLFLVARCPGESSLNYIGLLGILLALLFTISTTSSVTFIPYFCWIMAAVCSAALKLAENGVHRSSLSAHPFEQAIELPPMRVIGGHR